MVADLGCRSVAPHPGDGPVPRDAGACKSTIRQTIRVSVGGPRVRLRLSNEYGTKPLTIGAVRVALVDEKGKIRPGTERPVLFSGKPSASVPAGSPYLSDPIDLPVSALSSLSISIYVPDDTGPCTCHATGLQTAFVSASGDFTEKAFTPE